MVQIKQTPSNSFRLDGVRVGMVVNQIYYTDPRVMSYANTLAQAGALVDVIASKHSRRNDPNQHPNINVYSIPVARNYRSGFGYAINYIVSTIFFILYASVMYFKRKYHVVHIHNMPDTLMLAALFPKFFGAKAILDIHDPMPNVFMSKYHAGPDNIVVRFFSKQEEIAARFADKIITANPLFKDLLAQRGVPAEKILVINNIPNPKLFSHQDIIEGANEATGEFTLIFPGTIAPRYSLEIAVKSLPRLSQEIPNLKLRIIGKRTPHVEELVLLASELGVVEYLDFIPFVPTDQIASEIAKADIGIYPALPDAHMSIAMPGKVLEFVTIGIPVVASRLPILEAFFDDASILFFSPGKVDEFCAHILKLYHSPSLRQSLVASANKAFTDKYSWEKEFGQYVELIRNIVSS